MDRDNERFSDECLYELAELFVGKSGILDHNWSAAGQLARIYRTQVETETGRLNAAGEPYRYLKGWAYMLRNEDTENFISAIEAGAMAWDVTEGIYNEATRAARNAFDDVTVHGVSVETLSECGLDVDGIAECGLNVRGLAAPTGYGRCTKP